RFVARARRRQVWLLKPCLPPSVAGPIRDRGEETGDKRSQNRRRGASPDSAREKQRRSGRGPAPSQVMVAKGLNSDLGGASQSIIAALRMQTIVARAGLSLTLRMRWGMSQR